MNLWDELEQWVWRRREARAKRWLAGSPLRMGRRSAGIRIDGDLPRVRWPRQEEMERWRREYQLPEWMEKEVDRV